MINEGKVWQKVQSPQVVNQLTKILSTSEINKKFQKIWDDKVKFRLKNNYGSAESGMKRAAMSATNINSKEYIFKESNISPKSKKKFY